MPDSQEASLDSNDVSADSHEAVAGSDELLAAAVFDQAGFIIKIRGFRKGPAGCLEGYRDLFEALADDFGGIRFLSEGRADWDFDKTRVFI